MTSHLTQTMTPPSVTELPRALETVTPDTFIEVDLVDDGVRAPRPEPRDRADSFVDP
jgi:hypothetical protein